MQGLEFGEAFQARREIIMPLTGKEMLRLLQKNGWKLVRINGSHHILTKTGVPQNVSVPVKGNNPLAIGTENQILKKAGLR